MLSSRSLTDLAAALTPEIILAGARRIESWRSEGAESELDTWLGFGVPGAWTTPFMLQAGRLARAAGLVAFDRLERAFLPVPPAWVHPEIGPSGYATRLGHERLHAPPLWPFAIDAPMADFQTANLPPKWLSHSLVHALVGFGHWPGLTEWQLMHLARLSEVTASLHWYWLSELGRFDHRGLAIDLSELRGNDAAMYTLLEEDARSPENRKQRLSEETSRIIAENALEILGYEIYAYRQGMYEGDLVEPQDSYLGLGEAAEYAKTHLPRLRSASFERYLEHCCVPGRDYAATPEAFEARAARALASLIDGLPSAHADHKARARRTLQDVGWRLCHIAAHEDRPPVDLPRVADALARLDGADDPDAVVAEAVAGLEDSARALALALGYSPVADPAREPSVSREARATAVVSRAFATHPALGAALDGMRPVARRLLDGPRRGSLVAQVLPVAERAAQEDAIPWLGYAYLGWLQVAEHAWGDSSPANLEKRWHYRIARRTLPDDPSTFDAYEVAWNPYVKRYPLPFDATWNDALRKTPLGEAKPFRGKPTTNVSYCYLGAGRHGPLYLPLVPRLAALIASLKVPRRLSELVQNPDFGLEFLRAAVAEEAVLLFHKPAFSRPERAIDLFEVAMEAAAGLDQQVEPPGPWNEPAQAEAYARFCASSGHYRESSAALCDAVGFAPDARVGELGFGTGETSREILRRLGPEGRLVAVDSAVLMHEHVQTQPELGQDPRARFAAGGARALAWNTAHEAPFDCVLGNACIWLAPDMALAVEVLARATREGGKLGLSIPAEYLGYTSHVATDEAIAVATALDAARRDLGLAPPRAPLTTPADALGSTERFRQMLEAAGWRDVAFLVWERPWPASEYLDWLGMPVVSENLSDAPTRAPELIAALRARVEPTLPLVAAWYLITAVRA
jgi:ubiquinone/menaquinone biosynthesis C-methylase UbiE